jgi:hypothetical protein
MTKDMILPLYVLLYDEEIDAICSLELLAEHLPRVITVPHHWKWVILSLHNALQGFMVLSLQGTNMLNVLTKKSAEDWLKRYETGQPSYTPPKLDYFMDLYEKIKSDAMGLRTDSQPFLPSPAQDKSVKRLSKLRNEFAHYVPAGSAFNMKTWTKVVLSVIPIIEFLAFKSNNFSFHKEGRREQVAGLCVMAKKEASALLKYYGG